jgi:CDP-glucose 4,6-dehydratase
MLHGSVFVTGATGFTGYWLTKGLLRAGANITVLVPEYAPESLFVLHRLVDKVKIVPGSVLDFDLLVRELSNARADTVFHLAGVALEHSVFESPRESFEVNIRGTYNLLEACRLNAETITKVVVASSDKAYGDTPELPYRETMPVQGRNPYDVSKACMDMLARSYHHSYGLPVAVARFANIYGGADLNWSRLIPNTIRRLFRGERPIVRSPAAGVFRRDFLYKSDLVSAYICLLQNMHRPGICGQAYNFGAGECIEVPYVVSRIQHIMGREDLIPVVERSHRSEILAQQLLVEKAQNELDWSPKVSFDEGLRRTVAWYTGYLRDGASGVETQLEQESVVE